MAVRYKNRCSNIQTAKIAINDHVADSKRHMQVDGRGVRGMYITEKHKVWRQGRHLLPLSKFVCYVTLTSQRYPSPYPIVVRTRLPVFPT